MLSPFELRKVPAHKAEEVARVCTDAACAHPASSPCSQGHPREGYSWQLSAAMKHQSLPFPPQSHTAMQHSRKATMDSTFSVGFRSRGFSLWTKFCLSAMALSSFSSRYLGTMNSDR